MTCRSTTMSSTRSIDARDELRRYVDLWHLAPDGAMFRTNTSWLQPVRFGQTPAILKVAFEDEERRGAAVIEWWRGEGAAPVLAHEGDALLLDRAIGQVSLAEMASSGRDDEASRILCAVAERLHARRARPVPELVPLDRWFRELALAAVRHGGVLTRAAAVSAELLGDPQDVRVLHGDLHHGNVLDFGSRGWLAIDPKGLVGERGFDFANIFCNPNPKIAVAPGRVRRQAQVVAEAAGLERARLMRWILAYAGLSAAWSVSDGEDPALAITVAEIAAAEIVAS